MKGKKRANNRTMLLGCGLLGLVALIGAIALLAVIIDQDRQAARYPGAALVSRRNIYSPAANTVLWHDAFRHTEPVWDIFEWYHTQFGLTLDLTSHTMKDGCYTLTGVKRSFIVERRMNVVVCETPNGQTISVTRATSID
jgi:hypothetical protein